MSKVITNKTFHLQQVCAIGANGEAMFKETASVNAGSLKEAIESFYENGDNDLVVRFAGDKGFVYFRSKGHDYLTAKVVAVAE